MSCPGHPKNDADVASTLPVKREELKDLVRETLPETASLHPENGCWNGSFWKCRFFRDTLLKTTKKNSGSDCWGGGTTSPSIGLWLQSSPNRARDGYSIVSPTSNVMLAELMVFPNRTIHFFPHWRVAPTACLILWQGQQILFLGGYCMMIFSSNNFLLNFDIRYNNPRVISFHLPFGIR